MPTSRLAAPAMLMHASCSAWKGADCQAPGCCNAVILPQYSDPSDEDCIRV